MILIVLLIAVAAVCAYFAYRSPDFKAKLAAMLAAGGAVVAAFWEQLSAYWS